MKPEPMRCRLCGSYASEPCFGGITGKAMTLKHAPHFQVSVAEFNKACKCEEGQKCFCQGAQNRVPGKPEHGKVSRPPP